MTTKPISINLDKEGIARSLMLGRGAPKHLLRGKLEISEKSLQNCNHPAFRLLSPATQMGMLARTIANPLYGSYFMVIGTDHDEDLAEMVALAIMQSATNRSIASPETSARPLYSAIYGGNYDRLRQDPGYRSSIGQIGLLILTNMAINSTPPKIEVARDLLHMYASIPRILVVSGADPLAFAIDTLYRKPSRVLRLSRAPKHKRI